MGAGGLEERAERPSARRGRYPFAMMTPHESRLSARVLRTRDGCRRRRRGNRVRPGHSARCGARRRRRRCRASRAQGRPTSDLRGRQRQIRSEHARRRRAALVVSQFTLIADTRKGNRPSFTQAAPPEEAVPLYERFCEALAAEGVRVERGVFGARMSVELVNAGPVTIVLE